MVVPPAVIIGPTTNRVYPITIPCMADDPLLETADSYEDACERVSYWAHHLAMAGLGGDHGVYLKRLRLSERHVTFGIYVGKRESSERERERGGVLRCRVPTGSGYDPGKGLPVRPCDRRGVVGTLDPRPLRAFRITGLQ
jgi:hypothetical protein